MSDVTASEEHLDRAKHRAMVQQSAGVPSLTGGSLWRGVSLCIGASLLVTSVGLWAFASADLAVMLIKLGASIAFFGGAAVFLLMAIAPQDISQLEFDPTSQVFRVLEKDETGRFYVQTTHALANVEKLNFEAGALRAWDVKGTLLMAVPMRARSAREIMNAVLAIA